MRLGVVDVGSNTVRLVIADGGGAVPLPVHTAKHRLRLADHVDAEGRLAGKAVDELVTAVAAACEEAHRWGGTELFVFATAIVRDAPNRAEILEAVRAGAGVRIRVMTGETEAALTFLAARRWMGWRAGSMALLDIGGGSLEVAFGRSGLPDFAASLPLGAGRMTREFLAGQEVPDPEAVRAVRRRVRHQLRDVAARIRWEEPSTVVATSRTFQQLARLCGAAPGREGPFVPRLLARSDLRTAVRQLAGMPPAERAKLPGISAARSGQSPAGAVIAHTTMKVMGIEEVTVCPWGLREGVLLKHLESRDSNGWDDPAAPEGHVPMAVEPGPSHGAE